MELTVKPGAQVHSANVVNKKSAAITLNPLLRLKAEKGGYSDEMVIFFHENAAEGYDRYDTRKKMGSGPYPQLYTVIPGAKLAVNALPTPVLDEKLVIMSPPGNPGWESKSHTRGNINDPFKNEDYYG